ncbi:MAG TPA: DivIVA domain-containing protein [Actinobacteria bacterium]|nr:DivIVA domain-containing protein [Actinomycetes bacterium]HEX21146.1 DivIVA domain-containing protein [Actinomycetota bacterium]
MSLTPLDIHHKEFHRAIRGYNEEEVDVFLDQVADEFERMFNQNRELQEKVEKMQDKVKQYEGLEQTLQKALLTAQRAADEVQQNAKKESELIVKDAELKAREIIQNVAAKKEEVKIDLNTLKGAEKDFRSQFKNMLESYLKEIKKIENGERRAAAAKVQSAPSTPEKDKSSNPRPQLDKNRPAGIKSQSQEKVDSKIEVKIESKAAPMEGPSQEPSSPKKEEDKNNKAMEPEKKMKMPEKPVDDTEDKSDKKPHTQKDYDNYFNESSFFSDEEEAKTEQNNNSQKQDNDTQKSQDGGKPAEEASDDANPIADNVLESDQSIRYDYPEMEMEPKNIDSPKFSSYFADELGDAEDSNTKSGSNDNNEAAGSGPDDSGSNEIS